MPKKKKTPKQKSAKPSKNGKKRAVKAPIDPEMDVLEERFSAAPVDFNSLLDLVK